MDDETRAALHEWAALFNQGHYFEAHEALEAAWLRAGEPEKTALKGLIHAAVALYQYRRGNGHGARVKYASAMRYLAPSLPSFHDMDIRGLAVQMEQFFAPLIAQPEGAPPPPPREEWPRIGKMLAERCEGDAGRPPPQATVL